MKEIFNKFNELYGLPKNTPFKFIELWEALLEEFKEIAFSVQEETHLSDGQLFPKSYFFEAARDFDGYLYYTYPGNDTQEEALCSWFIKFHKELNTKLQAIIKEVYNV